MSGFVVGGVVPTSSDAYVERSFAHVVFGYLAAGDWVTVLGPRQHGKTSTLVRLQQHLSEEGISTALIDLSEFVDTSDDSTRWASFLAWLSSRVRTSLGLEPADVHMHSDLVGALAAALDGTAGATVLMLDEASRLPGNLGKQFFSQLRALHTAQRSQQTVDQLAGLTMLFCGTFRPDTVIDDDNSPFNVSRLVHTTDLSLDDVRELGDRVGDHHVAGWADRIYEEVGGQPYLVQVMFEALATADTARHQEIFDRALAYIEAGSDGHLPALFRRIAKEEGAEQLVARMVSAGPKGIRTLSDGLATFLSTVGIAQITGDLHLVARNPLYLRALESSPSFNPDAFIGAGADVKSSAGLGTIAPLTDDDLQWIVSDDLRSVVANLHAGGLTAARAGSFRVALAGLGATYEAVLLALVEQIDPATRTALCRRVKLNNGKHPGSNPEDCSFEGLVLVAHESGKLPYLPENVSHVARQWRNLIHPAVARRDFQAEADLQPEVQMTAAVIAKLIQHVR